MTQTKTIGTIIKNKRESLGLTYSQIVEELKIKQKFLEFIENDDFDSFYSKAQAKGFIRNYARLLKLNDEQLIAMYRRDVENVSMKRKITLLEDEEEVLPSKFDGIKESLLQIQITRKRISILMLLLVFLFLGFYLFRTLQKTFDKPELYLSSPFEVQGEFNGTLAYDKSSIVITGKTEPDVSITINGAPVFLNSLFEFESDTIPTTDEVTPIVIRAENNLGSVTEITLKLSKANVKFDDINAQINVNGITNLIIKADGAIKFDDTVIEGDSFPVKAIKTLEIISDDPSKISIDVNGENYKIDGNSILFRIDEGELLVD